jgi:hypothetical protein
MSSVTAVSKSFSASSMTNNSAPTILQSSFLLAA